MIRLVDLLNEAKQEQLEEGWKENILAAAIAVAGMFPAKAQKANSAEKPATTQTASQNALNINMGTLFPSGKYIIKDQEALKSILTQISDYMSKNPNANYKVDIVSSESKVPNVDAEKPNKPKVEPGYLATRRADEVKFAVEELVRNIKKTGAFKGNVDVDTATKTQQGPDWNPKKGDKSDMDKFTDHQFVKVVVKAEPGTQDTVTLDPYSVYANDGEGYYLNNQLYGLVFRDVRYSTKQTDAGNLDPSKQTVLLKLVKPNTAVTDPKKTTKGIYTGVNYVIPYQDWYTVVGTSHSLTPDMMKKWEKFKVQ